MATSETITDAELAAIEAAIECASPTEREHFNAKMTPYLAGLIIDELQQKRRACAVILAADAEAEKATDPDSSTNLMMRAAVDALEILEEETAGPR